MLTGGQVVAPEVGLKLDQVGLEVLGTARRVVVTKDDTTIIDGGGERARPSRTGSARSAPRSRTPTPTGTARSSRSASPSSPAASASSASARPPRSSSRSASTASRTPSRRPARPSRRASSPAAARRSSTPSPSLDDLGLEGDEATGANIVRKAADEPLRWIAENAGDEGYVVVDQGARERRRAPAATPRPGSTATWSPRASSTRSRSPARRCRTPRRSRAWCSPPTPWSWRRRKRSRRRRRPRARRPRAQPLDPTGSA